MFLLGIYSDTYEMIAFLLKTAKKTLGKNHFFSSTTRYYRYRPTGPNAKPSPEDTSKQNCMNYSKSPTYEPFEM